MWRYILSLSAILEIAPLLHHLVTFNQTTFSSSGSQLSRHGMTTSLSNCHSLPSYPAPCHALGKLFETDNTICEVCCQLASRSDCNLSPLCQGAVTCLVSTFSFQISVSSKHQTLLWVSKGIGTLPHRSRKLTIWSNGKALHSIRGKSLRFESNYLCYSKGIKASIKVGDAFPWTWKKLSLFAHTGNFEKHVLWRSHSGSKLMYNKCVKPKTVRSYKSGN